MGIKNYGYDDPTRVTDCTALCMYLQVNNKCNVLAFVLQENSSNRGEEVLLLLFLFPFSWAGLIREEPFDFAVVLQKNSLHSQVILVTIYGPNDNCCDSVVLNGHHVVTFGCELFLWFVVNKSSVFQLDLAWHRVFCPAKINIPSRFNFSYKMFVFLDAWSLII